MVFFLGVLREVSGFVSNLGIRLLLEIFFEVRFLAFLFEGLGDYWILLGNPYCVSDSLHLIPHRRI